MSQLRILQRQYFQLVEPQQLRWPDEATLKKPQVQAWVFANLLDPTRITSPTPARYQLRFLKELVGRLERSITDPEEDVWSPISSLQFLSLLLLCTAMYLVLEEEEETSCIGRNLLQQSADFDLLCYCRKYQMISWKQ